MPIFKKTVLQPGTYRNAIDPKTGKAQREYSFTPEELQETVASGNKMIADKIHIPIPRMHRDENGKLVTPLSADIAKDSSEVNYLDAATYAPPSWDYTLNEGFVQKFEWDDSIPAKDKDSPAGGMVAYLSVPGDVNNPQTPAGRFNNTVKGTSMAIVKEYTANTGETYKNAPIHAGAVINPMDQTQDGFDLISLSSGEDNETPTEVFLFSSRDSKENSQSPEDTQIDEMKDGGEEEGTVPVSIVSLEKLKAAVSESPIFNLPEDIELEKLVDALIINFHNEKQSVDNSMNQDNNDNSDKKKPLGQPKGNMNAGATTMSSDPIVSALVKKLSQDTKDSLNSRLDSLVAAGYPSDYANKTLRSQVNQIQDCEILMSGEEDNAPLLDENGNIQIVEPSVLMAIEAAEQAVTGGSLLDGKILGEPQDPSLDQHDQEEKQRQIQRLLGEKAALSPYALDRNREIDEQIATLSKN